MVANQSMPANIKENQVLGIFQLPSNLKRPARHVFLNYVMDKIQFTTDSKICLLNMDYKRISEYNPLLPIMSCDIS